jgi:hypothetical protein
VKSGERAERDTWYAMNPRRRALAAPLAASFVLGAALATPSVAGQSTPLATLRAEVRYLQGGDLASYYALLSPTFRKSCSFAMFLPT